MNYSFEHRLTTNKAVSFDLLRWEDWTEYFEFRVKIDRKTDHAGIEVKFTVLGLEVRISLFDIRHWNDEQNRWALPDDVFSNESDDESWSGGLNDD